LLAHGIDAAVEQWIGAVTGIVDGTLRPPISVFAAWPPGCPRPSLSSLRC
jgi:hypothetical protein